MKHLIIMALGVSLLFNGCAIHPKDYTGDKTRDVAREKIGENTTHGLINALFGAAFGIVAVSQLVAAFGHGEDRDDYKSDAWKYRNNPTLKAMYEKKAKDADDAETNGILMFFLWGGVTGGLIAQSVDCFKAKAEWEGELDRLRSSGGSSGSILSWDLRENVKLGLGYDIIFSNGYQDRLSFSLDVRY